VGGLSDASRGLWGEFFYSDPAYAQCVVQGNKHQRLHEFWAFEVKEKRVPASCFFHIGKVD